MRDDMSLGDAEAARKWAWPFVIRAKHVLHNTQTSVWDGDYRMDGFIYTRAKKSRPFARWRLHLNHGYGDSEEKPGVRPHKIEDVVGLSCLLDSAVAGHRDKRGKADRAATELMTLMKQLEVKKCVVQTPSGLQRLTREHSTYSAGDVVSSTHVTQFELDKLTDLQQLALVDSAFAVPGNAYMEAAERSRRAYGRKAKAAMWLEYACVRKLPRIDGVPGRHTLPSEKVARVDVGNWVLHFRPRAAREDSVYAATEVGWRLSVMHSRDQLAKHYTHLVLT